MDWTEVYQYARERVEELTECMLEADEYEQHDLRIARWAFDDIVSFIERRYFAQEG